MASKKTTTRLWVLGVAVVLILLVLSSGRDRPGSGASGGQASGPCLVRVTVDAPVRSGPEGNAAETGTLPAGMVIQVERTSRNNFRQVADNRWVAQQHVDPISGSDCG